MFDSENTFESLDKSARRFNLPKGYLKQLIEEGLIPSLNVNGRLRLNPEIVKRALAGLAANENNNTSVQHSTSPIS